jgi:hypothetical protein
MRCSLALRQSPFRSRRRAASSRLSPAACEANAAGWHAARMEETFLREQLGAEAYEN